MADEKMAAITYDGYEEESTDGFQERTGERSRPRGHELAGGMIGLMGAASDFDLYNRDWKLDGNGNSQVTMACRMLAANIAAMKGDDGKVRDPYGEKSMAALSAFAGSLERLDVQTIDGKPAAKSPDPTQPISSGNPLMLFGHEVHYPMDAFDSVSELAGFLQPDTMAYLHVDMVKRPIEDQAKALLFSKYTSELTQDAADSLVQEYSAGHKQEAHDRFCKAVYDYHMVNEAEHAGHAGKPQASPTAMVQLFKDSYERASHDKGAYGKFLDDAKSIHQASALAGRLDSSEYFTFEYYDDASLAGNDRTILDIEQLEYSSLEAVKRMSKAAGLTIENGDSVSLFGRDISMKDTGRDAFLAIQDFMKGAQDAQLEQNYPALRAAAKSEAVKGRMAHVAQPDAQAPAKDRQFGE